MTLDRGFKRIAMILVAVSLPVIWFFAYEASDHLVGYRPRLVTAEDPALNGSGMKPVLVEGVGVFYFRSHDSETEMQDQIKATLEEAAVLRPNASTGKRSLKEFAAAVRLKYPEHANLSDLEVTNRIVTKHPVYRKDVDLREFKVEAVRERRVLWALGLTAIASGGMCAALLGSIAALSWVARGFRGE